MLTEKLGTPDKATTHKLVQQRIADAAACASPICEWYDAKLQRLALLEFDRDRKSMGVIARQTPYTRHSGEHMDDDADGGWQTVTFVSLADLRTALPRCSCSRRLALEGSELLVKGAAECVLQLPQEC